SSLAKLLAGQRGVRNVRDLPPLMEDDILCWADVHHRQTARWPTEKSGPVEGAAGETWGNVNAALRSGTRGLPGRDSLAKLLARSRRVRTRAAIPKLTETQILAWADAHHDLTGRWPRRDTGIVQAAADETWAAVDAALAQGCRGL